MTDSLDDRLPRTEAQRVRRLVEERELLRLTAAALATALIEDRGPTYSRELRDHLRTLGLDLPHHQARLVLVDLERKGVLSSTVKDPPHHDNPSSSIQRRYFDLKR